MESVSMSSKIIVVSTRPPATPLSGGMAPAVKKACESFDEVCWYAVGNRDSLSREFGANVAPALNETNIRLSTVAGMKVKQILVDGKVWDSHYNKFSNS